MDGSGEIVEEFAHRVSPESSACIFKAVHQENAGASAARNRGLEAATGDYLWFVDGDDVIASDAFGVLAEVVREFGNPDIVQFGHERFEASGPGFVRRGRRPIAYDLTCLADLRTAYREHAEWLLASNGIFRRERFNRLHFENLANGEDSLWGRRTFFRAHSLVYVDEELYGYRQRSGSATNADWTRRRWRDFCRSQSLMIREGLRVRGVRCQVALDAVRQLWRAWLFRRKIVG